eukprot:2951521-Pleurochrysis_carterae.AAC.1
MVMGAAHARGQGRTWAVAQGGGRSEVRGGHRERLSKSLESEARSERERSASTHAMQCDAMQIWGTMH